MLKNVSKTPFLSGLHSFNITFVFFFFFFFVNFAARLGTLFHGVAQMGLRKKASPGSGVAPKVEAFADTYL